MKWQGECLAIGGYEPNPINWDVEKDFSFGLFDLDWDVFGFNLDGHLKRVPILENTGIAHTVCGPESFTPDHKPLVGPSSQVEGFWFNCGYNSSGIMLSGGASQQLVEWMEHGQPSIDIFGFDVNRFHDRFIGNKKWLEDRSQEAYAKNYAIVFPHDQPLAGRNMRKTPFHDRLIEHGCVHQEVHGWERPLYFMGPGGESTAVKDYDYYGYYDTESHASHRYFDLLKHEYKFDWPDTFDVIGQQSDGTRNAVALYDMSPFGKLKMTGPDAKAAADYLATNNVSRPGKVTYTQMCNEAGGVEADLTYTCISENEYYVVTAGASFQHDRVWMENVIRKKGFNVQLEDITEDIGVLSLQGRYAREVLGPITSADLSNDAFPFGTWQDHQVAGVDVRLQRLTFVGELGWEIHIPKADCVKVYDAIFESGKPYGIINAGYSAIESLSLEKGYKHWHADVRVEDTPLECGTGFACKFKTDIDFCGRQALEKQKKEGYKKRCAYIYPEDTNVAIFGLETLYRNGKVCGFLRRGGYSYTLKRSIGVAYITDPDGGVVNPDFVRYVSFYVFFSFCYKIFMKLTLSFTFFIKQCFLLPSNSAGEYELDVMGRMIKATADVKTPFDPKNRRPQGDYSDDTVPGVQDLLSKSGSHASTGVKM